MGKPLLTDDVLERARKGQPLQDQQGFGYYEPQEGSAAFEEAWDEEYQGYQEGQTIRIPVDASIVKSRRIETVKREAFRSKVNRILFWVVLLLIVLIVAVLFW